jgi:hydroxypyruvate reductase
VRRADALLDIVTSALHALDPEARVAAALASPPRAPVFLVAIGKAAPAMARGALSRWRAAIVQGVVVCPEGTPARGIPRGIDVMRASHPVPDARSVRAAARCLALAADAGAARGILLGLVSGGASALVCAPSEGIDLATKRAVTRAMLRSGAPVQEINVVRKHLSRIKGGGLARAARPARVLALVASDVVGGTAADVGSGPTVGEASTVADARRLLLRWAPRFASLPLVRTLAPPRRAAARIVVSPEELAAVVARRLGARVLRPSQASAAELAGEVLALAARMAPGSAFVRAAEPSLEVPPHARGGGRSTHLAALVGRDLPPGVAFLALATDGVDGTSGTAGAIVRAGFADRAAIDRALARFDTGALHRAAGTAIASRPSGINLADLHVLVAARR